MKPRLKTSPAARELIKRYEPFRSEAQRDADGRWVVGYGHRAAAKAGVRVSEDEAALLLIYDVMRAEEVVDDSITGPLSRGQRDALTSFVHDVGAERFRDTDVARYLFEGRARAAAEALAAHGDGASARREAESKLFLEALLPAKPEKARKSEPVELVIKIEHPAEERVLEGAIAGGDAPPPPEAYSDLPPPPPPLDAGQVRRREAEDEIARILATVQALPPEVRQDLTDPVAGAVLDTCDDTIDAAFEAVDEADALEVEMVEPVADGLPVAEVPAIAEDGTTSDAEAQAEPTDPEAAADRVIARMAEEIGEGLVEAEVGDDAHFEAEAARDVETGAEVSEPVVDAPAEPEPVADGAPTVETPVAAFDVPELMGLGFELADSEPVADAAPTVKAPVAAFDLPERMGLGFVLAEPEPEPVADGAPTVETPVAAFDLPERMGLGFVLANRQPVESAEAEEPADLPEHYSLDLPAGTRLGYALSNVIQGRFFADAEQDAVMDAPSSIASGSDEAEEAPVDAVVAMPEEVEPEAAAPEVNVVEAPDAEAVDPDMPEVVERAVSLSGDDMPPPHPGENPAEANGAVGEVIGEARDDASATQLATEDDLGDGPMMSGQDPMASAVDDFSPSDLASDVQTADDRPRSLSDDGMWTFLAVLIAGGLLAGFGSVLAASEWDYIMEQREMTLNFGMALAGFFLVIVAGWQLASIWLSKLKQKAAN